MARGRSPQADGDGGKRKQLRKRLRKAEDQLADAQQKRDRAQARVEALAIIADEIRAQLADADKAAGLGPAAETGKAKPAASRSGAAAKVKPTSRAGGQNPKAVVPGAASTDGESASNSSATAARRAPARGRASAGRARTTSARTASRAARPKATTSAGGAAKKKPAGSGPAEPLAMPAEEDSSSH